MKKEIFAIPIFEDTIDVERLKLPDLECEPTWDSGIPTTFCKQLELCEDAYKALGEVVDRNLYEANLMGPMQDSDICGTISMMNTTTKTFIFTLSVSGVL